jgi:CHAT domain-containing protein/tetratricopeptide (TPR) repeat protein
MTSIFARRAAAIGLLALTYGASTGGQTPPVQHVRRAQPVSVAPTRDTPAQLLHQVLTLQRQEDARGIERSIVLARRALTITQARGDREEEARAWQALARSQYLLGRLDAAIGDYTSAVDIRQAMGARVGEAAARAYRASAYWAQGKTVRAVEDYSKAAEMARATGEIGLEAYAINGLGNAYTHNDPARSREHYEQALALWRAAGDLGGQGMALNNLGELHKILGERQRALSLFREALPLMRDAGQLRRSADALLNMGDIYNALARPVEATAFFEQALAIERATGDKRNEARAARLLGAAFVQRGQLATASRHYARALMLAREVGDRGAEGDALHGRGELAAAAGRHEQAMSDFTLALEAHRQASSAHGQGADLHATGEVLATHGKHASALDAFERALALRRVADDRVGEAETRYQLARLRAAEGALDTARTEIESSIALAESQRTNLATPGLRTSYFSTVQTYYRWYVDLLMRLHDAQPRAGFARRALDVSERSRARGLLDRLNEAGADVLADVDPELVQRQHRIRQMISVDANRRDELPATATAERRDLDTNIASLLTEYEAVQAEILETSQRYAALAQPTPLGDTGIQALLDDDTTLVVYVLGIEKVYAWVITRSDIRVTTLGDPRRLERLTRRALAAMASNPFTVTASPRALAALSSVVLEPIGAALRTRRVAIVLDGALEYVPVGALPAPRSLAPLEPAPAVAAAGRPLIADREVVYLPSASALGTLRSARSRRRSPEALIAVLADPVFAADDPRVPARRAIDPAVPPPPRLASTRKEAQAIADIAGSNARVALDFHASRDAALAGDLGRFSIVHFATHAVIDDRHPELAGIMLSRVTADGRPQDGLLRLHDVYGLRWSADLVVLSACRTALGPEIRGEGLVSLVDGFMAAGARRVVASLWTVDDDATAELMRAFYTALLRDRLEAPAALCRAQLHVRQQARWQEPFYWAAFVLQGDWQ